MCVNLKVAYISSFTFANHPDQNSLFSKFSGITGFWIWIVLSTLSLSHQVVALVPVYRSNKILEENNPRGLTFEIVFRKWSFWVILQVKNVIICSNLLLVKIFGKTGASSKASADQYSLQCDLFVPSKLLIQVTSLCYYWLHQSILYDFSICWWYKFVWETTNLKVITKN